MLFFVYINNFLSTVTAVAYRGSGEASKMTNINVESKSEMERKLTSSFY